MSTSSSSSPLLRKPSSPRLPPPPPPTSPPSSALRHRIPPPHPLRHLLESFQQSFPSLSFPPLPERGDFDLKDVLDSTYFFN
ncbi:hypothetical protein J5N97_022355 [Dioscorea zingiberensis]|uniref:DNA-directed RNA polymerase n=1 Tax=Dioscorea zingiberensis TaxID=325984 RepID=A0A9D5CA84_9LILI|nr:hypothetical protein J5N97_022355 [Dioscorea zingiberensis]